MGTWRDLLLVGGAVVATLALQRLRRRRKAALRFPAASDSIKKLPNEADRVLESARLGYLGLVLPDGTPHVCLMNITYVDASRSVVFSTRMDTVKFRSIQHCPRATLLLHDFPASAESRQIDKLTRQHSEGTLYGKTVSITLYGDVHVLDGPLATTARDQHLRNHPEPEYQQFIVGSKVAMLCLDVDQARICDISDKVQHWHI
jgi:hypothetical protein